MDVRDYTPNVDVLKKLKRVVFVAVVGPTAAGKSTLITAAQVREPRLHLVRVHTSRDPRPGEHEGQEMYFRNREEMEQNVRKGSYVQIAPAAFGDLYATAPEDYSVTGVALMPTLADAVDNFRSLPFKQVRTLYIVPPDWLTWQQRIKERNFTPEALHKRLEEARRSLTFALHDESTHFVVNNGIGVGAEDLTDIALAKPMSARLQADQSLAREICADFLNNLRRTL